MSRSRMPLQSDSARGRCPRLYSSPSRTSISRKLSPRSSFSFTSATLTSWIRLRDSSTNARNRVECCLAMAPLLQRKSRQVVPKKTAPGSAANSGVGAAAEPHLLQLELGFERVVLRAAKDKLGPLRFRRQRGVALLLPGEEESHALACPQAVPHRPRRLEPASVGESHLGRGGQLFVVQSEKNVGGRARLLRQRPPALVIDRGPPGTLDAFGRRLDHPCRQRDLLSRGVG